MKVSSSIPPSERPSASALRAAYAASRDRKLRNRLFSHRRGLFHDPAWDMLVELFIAHEEGERLSTSAVCLAAGVAMSTALRHLTLLEEQGLVARNVDPTDRRRCFNQLTATALRELTSYFEDVR